MAPGEAEPKIQRRVGTSFSISLDIMSKQTKVRRLLGNEMILTIYRSFLFQADQIAKLEADVEIQRKIVTAALRLANDVTTNKMVRRKRRRDYQCAQLRLRELEQHLHQLRLSSSKPDLPNVHLDSKTIAFCVFFLIFMDIFLILLSLEFVSNGSLTKNLDGPLRITKSAPNTPRGSVSDLTDGGSINERVSKLVVAHKPPIAQRPPNLPLGQRFNILAHLQERSLHHSSSFPSDPRALSVKIWIKFIFYFLTN